MGKIVLLLVAFMLIFSSIVIAGESQDIDLFQARTQAVYLYEGDEVRFDLLGDTHSLIVEEISSTGTMVKFNIVPFMHDDNTRAWPGIVGLDTIMKVDLDKDGNTDINVALYTIKEDGLIHLIIQRVTDEDITGDVGLIVDSEDKSNLGSYFLTGLGVFLILLVAFFVFKGGMFNKKDDESKEEKLEEVAAEKVDEEEEEFSDDEDDSIQ
ncbi:MAG: hypothetical protein Q8Q35_01175 [Nanoarchaeota archaeon]|nr:hypothetical protein [Nanoarchaeota archaeon]